MNCLIMALVIHYALWTATCTDSSSIVLVLFWVTTGRLVCFLTLVNRYHRQAVPDPFRSKGAEGGAARQLKLDMECQTIWYPALHSNRQRATSASSSRNPWRLGTIAASYTCSLSLESDCNRSSDHGVVLYETLRSLLALLIM